MKKNFLYLVTAIVVLHISCKDEKEYPNENELNFSLNQTEISFDNIGGTSKVELTANGPWQINEIPDWIIIDQTKGNTSKEITVTVAENENAESRESKIHFVRESNIITLKVSQGAKEINKVELTWSSLNFSLFDDSSFVLGDNGIERTYSFKINSLFINPDANTNISEKIFLGNLVNRKLNKNTDISVYTGYTFNPIDIFPSIGKVYSQTITPSLSNQNNYANQILSKKPTGSERFLSDWNGTVYNSHRELHLIGISNMGINLDEIISENSYKVQEMTKKNGVIYSFCHTLFTLNMNLEHTVKEELNKDSFPDNTLSYISSVSYGRIGLLIIESDNNIAKIKPIVHKIRQSGSESLSANDIAILDELNAYHLFYDQSRKLKVINGKIYAIESYINQITGDFHDVFPYKFTLSDYFNNSQASMTFKMILP